MTEDTARDDDRVSLHPLKMEDALDALLATEPPSSRGAMLDELTFADPAVRERLDRRDEAISSDEMWSRVRRSS